MLFWNVFILNYARTYIPAFCQMDEKLALFFISQDILNTRLCVAEMKRSYKVQAKASQTLQNVTYKWFFLPEEEPGSMATSSWHNFHHHSVKAPVATFLGTPLWAPHGHRTHINGWVHSLSGWRTREVSAAAIIWVGSGFVHLQRRIAGSLVALPWHHGKELYTHASCKGKQNPTAAHHLIWIAMHKCCWSLDFNF